MDVLTAQFPPTPVTPAPAIDREAAVDSPPRRESERIALAGLPRGWATTGLIMRCGFMVATFAWEMQERARIRRRVLRRAKQVL